MEAEKKVENAGAVTLAMIKYENMSQPSQLARVSYNRELGAEKSTLATPLFIPNTLPQTADTNEATISGLVSQLELQLKTLSLQVSSFQEDALLDTVTSIIRTDRSLRSRTDELAHHGQLGTQVLILQNESTDLDTRLKDILRKLVTFRSELYALPKLLTSLIASPQAINVSDTLVYALKLAKFTKVPAPMANAHHQVHPNNFVWPAEDALRRGMLAASSLQPTEIINAEIGSSAILPSAAKQQQDDADDSKHEGQDANENSTERSKSSSDVLAPQPALDLDLFDEDEFSD